ncbi:MAG TPA: putative Ig domain-containing protein, partial [Steroidobacteraceae bacterium]|nr:putative Ig domain-containing protein [Steroidobacteraceae bacterium]
VMFQTLFAGGRRTALLPLLLMLVGLCTSPQTHAANAAPTISGTPDTVAIVGYPYWFRPTASDVNGDTLRFSIFNKPAWAAFQTDTGTLSGTPQAAGTYSNIRIRVSDGHRTRSLPAFSITVSANAAPRISGTPSTSAVVGQAWAFQPTASDPNGQPLTFSVANKPAWATFSTSTGRLAGTPGSTGSWSNIVIKVTDGMLTSALPAFTITATSSTTTTGSATLHWTPPTHNIDGSPIDGLSGYKIAYGPAPGSYDTTLSVGSGAVTSAVIENLPHGTWYFAVQAIAVDGRASAFSPEVSKSL